MISQFMFLPFSFAVAEQRSFRDQVSLHTPATAQAGVTVTLTLTVNDLHSADSNYAVAYLTVVPQVSDKRNCRIFCQKLMLFDLLCV